MSKPRLSQRHVIRSALDIDRNKDVILTLPSDPGLRLSAERKVGAGTAARRFRVWTYRYRDCLSRAVCCVGQFCLITPRLSGANPSGWTGGIG